MHLVDDVPELQAHHEEDAVLEEEQHGAPVQPLVDARLRRQGRGAPMTRPDARGHHREDAGRPDLLRRDEGHERHGEGDRGVEDGVVEPSPHLGGDDADDDADREGAHRGEHEAPGGLPQVDGCADGGDRGAQQDERRRVVHEALPLEDGDEARWQAEPARDARRGDGVGRADHGAEGQRAGEGQVREERVEQQADPEGRHEHQHHREADDRAEVAPQVHERHRHGGSVQQRRQDAREDQLGRHLDGRHAREVGDPDPDEHEDQGRGHADAPRQERDGHEGRDPGDAESRVVHAQRLARRDEHPTHRHRRVRCGAVVSTSS
ncbi:hypothetical protein CMMCAS04_09595 [Clavibacter michiganensis subsp. michiganensis]|nr:hypothetical protein CMMCAS04_09595 [Clavibacter michiganensis subsp. michiganensis]